MDRKPKGYRGIGHETIGSDILSVLAVVLNPEAVLGHDLTVRLRSVKPDQWYPIDWILEPMDVIAQRIGPFGLKAMGRQLFKNSHEENVKRNVKTADELVHGLDAMYHFANRGEAIGGWRVVSFEPGKAVLDKTTPHQCKMEEGLLSQALLTIGVPASVMQTSCFRAGDESCVYEITSAVRPELWGRP